jgi:hypothetical protein
MIYITGRHFELEQFSLLDDLKPWLELEIEQRTGKKVTARPVAPKPAASGAPAAPSGSPSPPAKTP